MCDDDTPILSAAAVNCPHSATATNSSIPSQRLVYIRLSLYSNNVLLLSRLLTNQHCFTLCALFLLRWRRLMIKSRAAVAFAPNQPLQIVEVDVEAPKAGEVLIRTVASGVCHTDAYTLSGADSEGVFPCIL